MNYKDKLEKRLLSIPGVAAIEILGTLIIFFNSITDALDSLERKLGLKRDVLILAREDSKGIFSRKLVEEAYRRLFWANSFVARLRQNAPNVDIDLAWNRYIETVEEWSAQLVNNQQQLLNFYSEEKELEFNSVVDFGFKDIHSSLLDLRYSSANDDIDKLRLVSTKIDSINVNIYFFALQLPPRNK